MVGVLAAAEEACSSAAAEAAAAAAAIHHRGGESATATTVAKHPPAELYEVVARSLALAGKWEEAASAVRRLEVRACVCLHTFSWSPGRLRRDGFCFVVVGGFLCSNCLNGNCSRAVFVILGYWACTISCACFQSLSWATCGTRPPDMQSVAVTRPDRFIDRYLDSRVSQTYMHVASFVGEVGHRCYEAPW